MGRSQRAKGIRGELAAREVLLELTGFEWERSARQSRELGGEGCPDLVPTDGRPHPLHAECKVGAHPRVLPALDQAEADADPDHLPIVLAKRDREPWVLAVRAGRFWELVEVLGGHRPKRAQDLRARLAAAEIEVERLQADLEAEAGRLRSGCS